MSDASFYNLIEDRIVTLIQAVTLPASSTLVFPAADAEAVRPWEGDAGSVKDNRAAVAEMLRHGRARVARVAHLYDEGVPSEEGRIDVHAMFTVLVGVTNFRQAEARRGGVTGLGINALTAWIIRALHNASLGIGDATWWADDIAFVASSGLVNTPNIVMREMMFRVRLVPKG